MSACKQKVTRSSERNDAVVEAEKLKDSGATTQPAGASHIHCVIPPYMVDAIIRKGTADQRAQIENLVAVSNTMRGARALAPGFAPEPAVPVQAFLPSVDVAADAPAEPSILVFDMQGNEDRGELPGVSVRNDVTVSGDADVDRAWDCARETWMLYATEYQRDSLDDAGMPIVSSVHFGNAFNNAFWEGSQMVYGDGDGELFNSFTSTLSVVAHELTHGVIQFSGGLVYQDQSGALNEHIADVFGALAEQREAGQQSRQASWLIGDGLLTMPGMALRSMAEPGTAYNHPILGLDPQPFHMDSYKLTMLDNGGVHWNSGIPNHAFYLAAMMLGQAAWDEPGHIWYQALQNLNNPSAQFADFAQETVDAARQLHGAGSREARLVSRAWVLVGVL